MGDGDDGGGCKMRVAVAVRRWEASSMMVVVVVEEENNCLLTPKLIIGKSR